MLMNLSLRAEGPTTTPSAISPVDRLYFRGTEVKEETFETAGQGTSHSRSVRRGKGMGIFPEQIGTQLGTHTGKTLQKTD